MTAGTGGQARPAARSWRRTAQTRVSRGPDDVESVTIPHSRCPVSRARPWDAARDQWPDAGDGRGQARHAGPPSHAR